MGSKFTDILNQIIENVLNHISQASNSTYMYMYMILSRSNPQVFNLILLNFRPLIGAYKLAYHILIENKINAIHKYPFYCCKLHIYEY